MIIHDQADHVLCSQIERLYLGCAFASCVKFTSQRIDASGAIVVGWQLQEDATKILAYITVDQKTKHVYGLNESPDVICPDTEQGVRALLVDNVAQIAEYVVVTVLTPILAKGSVPFPAQYVCCYGSNNRFTSEHVSARQSVIIQRMLHHHMAPVLCDGSDGDLRYLALQYAHALFGAPGVAAMEHELLIFGLKQTFFSFQDLYVQSDTSACVA